MSLIANKKNFADSALFLSPPDNWGSVVGAMKPGAHLLLFNDVRNHHLGAITVEDHGLEIRDTIAYVLADGENGGAEMQLIAMARKPLCGTVAENVLRYGTGGINIDACRIGADKTDLYFNRSLFQGRYEKSGITSFGGEANWKHGDNSMPNSAGRWPANLTHCGSPAVQSLFPQTNKQAVCKSDDKSGWQTGYVGGSISKSVPRTLYLDEENGGSAARFFYSAPCLTDLCSYLINLVTPPNGYILTDCEDDGLPSDYSYVRSYANKC